MFTSYLALAFMVLNSVYLVDFDEILVLRFFHPSCCGDVMPALLRLAKNSFLFLTCLLFMVGDRDSDRNFDPLSSGMVLSFWRMIDRIIVLVDINCWPSPF